ncbi:ABC transporter substrate-binding protein [Lacisediminihabitans changchengi]|uniref:ABC transporter substrate-binding protein n=1 Tax=Lacisediminihabitans changchengi TaxID=2787634 RepID=A0A934VYS1_9MICO|nr:ABC transporter substrate-binding protein [Lacisediminihabitans changchengi]MBK4348347.1 ABC transporter substrate-binding protein [Lacisediminihabitans changchengi]
MPVRFALLAVPLVLLLAACTTASPASSHTAPMPTSPASVPAGDGVLRVGTLFPLTGTASYLGPAQADGVKAAVAAINAAGGVLGRPAEIVPADSGDVSSTTAETSLAALQAKGVDVIVGPSSSALAERLYPTALAARIPLISPAATSVRLSALQGGYFFRTVPSAADQGAVLASVFAATAATRAAASGGAAARVAIVYADDATSRDIRSSLATGLLAHGGGLVSSEAYTATTTDFAPIAAAVAKTAPDAVVLVSTFGAMDQNRSVIAALTAAGLGHEKLWLTSANLADYSQALPNGTLLNVNGVLEGVDAGAGFLAALRAVDPTVENTLYAAEAYDATVLAALAAESAGNDSGVAVATALPGVSSRGIKCTSYAECLTVLRNHGDVDYDGLTGAIAFDRSGDPHPAHYGLYRYDGENRFSRVGTATE